MFDQDLVIFSQKTFENKFDAIRDLTNLVSNKVTSPKDYFEAVKEREDTLATYVEYGVAIPHAKTNAVKEPFVVYEKLGTEESVSLSQVAQVIHLPGDILYAPLTLAGMQEIDAQSRSHHAALGLLLPVDGERIELVAPEIHHGVKFVHQAFLEPSAGILEHAGVGVPASTLVTA